MRSFAGNCARLREIALVVRPVFFESVTGSENSRSSRLANFCSWWKNALDLPKTYTNKQTTRNLCSFEDQGGRAKCATSTILVKGCEKNPALSCRRAHFLRKIGAAWKLASEPHRFFRCNQLGLNPCKAGRTCLLSLRTLWGSRMVSVHKLGNLGFFKGKRF